AGLEKYRLIWNWWSVIVICGGVFPAEIFSEQQRRATREDCVERARHGKCIGIHGRLNARRDTAVARAGKGARAAPQDRERTCRADRAPERRSDAQYAGRIGGRERDGDYLEFESCCGARTGHSRIGVPAI